MKTDTKTAQAAFEQAREYVAATKSAIEALQQRRTQLAAAIAELETRPAPWPEVVEDIVEGAIGERAAQYLPAITNHIRSRNPNLARRGSYDDLPFFGDGLSASESIDALCFLVPDLLKPRLQAMLMKFTPSHPADQCIGKAERETKLAALREDERALDREIAQLQGALAALKG